MSINVEETSFWTMFARLREFEGRRCWGRLAVAALLYALIPLFFVAATVFAAYAAGNDFKLETAVVAAAVAGVSGMVGPRLARRRFYRRLIADRLWSYEKPNPRSEVQVLVTRADVVSAQMALRKARFNPSAYTVRLGSPPIDAPDLNHKIGVNEPEAWPQSSSDDDRTRRIVSVLEAAGIRARAGGIDTQDGDPLGTHGEPPAKEGRVSDRHGDKPEDPAESPLSLEP